MVLFFEKDFNTKVKNWNFDSKGRLTDANGALPWIVFKRDLQLFKKLFPNLELSQFSNFSPLLYNLSGGLSLPQMLPSSFLNTIKLIENKIRLLNNLFGMFTKIVVRKK